MKTCSLQNDGSKENYINAATTKREMSFHRLDCWRGPPNNHPQDPARILGFHPRIHLNNDAGKLSRLMVATRKYKGNL
jgi:hypothetical protein